MRIWAETLAQLTRADGEIQLGGMHTFGFRAQCPVCGEAPEGATVACPSCGTPHHRDCWNYAGRCALYACEHRPERGAATAATPRFEEDPAAWLLHLLRPRNPENAWLSLRVMATLGTSAIVGVTLTLMLAYSALVRSVEAEVRAKGFYSERLAGETSSPKCMPWWLRLQ